MNKYLNMKTGEILSAEQVKNANPEAIITKVDHLSHCLFGTGYGELRY
jgi:hypothetical protein